MSWPSWLKPAEAKPVEAGSSAAVALRLQSKSTDLPTKRSGVGTPPTREIGASGTIVSGGRLWSEDLNSDWKDPKRRAQIIEEMRNTDGQVQASLLVCRLPILASTWLVKPPENPTDEEEKIAKFVDSCIHGMEDPWEQTLEQILSYQPFGFSVFEKVYEIDEDGMFRWKKWAPRHQTTIWGWNTDANGGLKSVTQYTQKGENKYQDYTLSVDRLLIFSHAKEGSNWEGKSILRSAYKHYYIKDKLYRIDAVAHERHGVGLPKVTIPRGMSEEDIAKVEKILEDLRSHECAYIVLPEGVTLEILAIPTQLRNPIESIKHHDEKIATSVLAQFLNLGFSASGSRALGQSFSDFFLNTLTYHTSYIAGIINRDAVNELVDVNFGTQKRNRYPKLRAVPVAGIDFERYARSLMVLFQTQVLTQDADTEAHVREVLGLPRFNPKTKKRLRPASGAQPKGATDQPSATNGNGQSAGQGMQDQMNPAKEKAATYLRPFVELQIANLVSHAKNGCDGRFRPPLEGTLAQALSALSGVKDSKVAQMSANEFSRRLASAAERGFVAGDGDPEEVSRCINVEADRSMSILIDSVAIVEEKK